MSDQQPEEKPEFGQPLDIDELQAMADPERLEAAAGSAVIWWDEHASTGWIGALKQ